MNRRAKRQSHRFRALPIRRSMDRAGEPLHELIRTWAQAPEADAEKETNRTPSLLGLTGRAHGGGDWQSARPEARGLPIERGGGGP